MTEQERKVDIQACKRELNGLWGKYGLLILLEALAVAIDQDARDVEKCGRFAGEVELKDGIVRGLREAAASPLWEI